MKNNLFLFYLLYFLLISLNIINCAIHTKEEWKSRSIYQLLTDRFASTDDKIKGCTNLDNYCGGTFKGIIQHLDYIAGMGFNAIWISPPLKNKPGSYHGYHNIDLYSINDNFGTAQELKDLIKACHDKDIWVILDAVPNHMAGGLDISTFNPFNLASHYHTLTDADCNGHWNEQYYKENCRIYGMPDLKQEDSYVNQTLISWLDYTVKEYGFDGVRYADVVNIPTWFWSNLTYILKGMYTIGVFDDNRVDYTASYLSYMDGVADIPLFNQLRTSFCDGSMIDLDNYIKSSRTIFKTPQYNGVWFDYHDKERFLYECSIATKYKGLRNVIIFTLFSDGIPIFYYGDEQYFDKGGAGDGRRQTLFRNYDQESDLYQMIKIANELRRKYKIYDNAFISKYVDEDNYVFTRGKDILIAVSKGKNKIIEVDGFNDDDKFCNRLKTLDCISVNKDKIIINMDGEPKIYVRSSKGHTIYISSLLFILILLALF